MSEVAIHGLDMNAESRISLLHETIDERGLSLRYVHVADISDTSPTREARQEMIAEQNELIRQHPEWEAPEIDASGQLILKNPVSEWLYKSPAIHAWRQDLVPSADALLPMQRTEESTLPIRLAVDDEGIPYAISGGDAIDDDARSFFVDSLDGIGIRTRAVIMAEIAQGHIGSDDTVKWLSLACGAAHPVFEALQSVSRGGDINARLHLIDYDQGTLESARRQSLHYGLQEGEHFTVSNRNLITDMIITDRLVEEHTPESARLVDALGIFEYFDSKRSAQFLNNAYKLVEPGGAVVISNMLSTRREIDLNQRGVGWPKIFPRTIEELTSIIEAADISLDTVTITVPEDGIYAVAEIRK